MDRAKLGVRRSLVRMVAVEFDRLSGSTNWIDLEFVKREWTPERISEVDIQLDLAFLTLSNMNMVLMN
jgi:putative transposase